MTDGLRSDCFEGSGDENAWRALKLSKSCKFDAFSGDGLHRASSVAGKAYAATSAHDGGRSLQKWREAIKRLYCRSLARAVAEALFRPYRIAGTTNLPAEQAAFSASIPASWLQATIPTSPSRVERMRLLIMQRLASAEMSNAARDARANGKGAHSPILEKAA